MTVLARALDGLIPAGAPVAVGISGGSDSMAALSLTQAWAQVHQAPVVALLVDHGMDNLPQDIITQVQQACALQRIPLQVLTCVYPYPLGTRKGLMAQSRNWQYALMAWECHRRGIRHLVLGHHKNDQLETVWMRAHHASHWRGQAGMSRVSHAYGLTLVRPWLAVEKEALRDHLRGRGQTWVDDPINTCLDFERNRARVALAEMTQSQRDALWATTCQHGQRRQAEAQALAALVGTPLVTPGALTVERTDIFQHIDQDQGSVLLQGWLRSFGFRSRGFGKATQDFWITLRHAFAMPPRASSTRAEVVGTFQSCVFVRIRARSFSAMNMRDASTEPLANTPWILRIFRQPGRWGTARPMGPGGWIWGDSFYAYLRENLHVGLRAEMNLDVHRGLQGVAGPATQAGASFPALSAFSFNEMSRRHTDEVAFMIPAACAQGPLERRLIRQGIPQLWYQGGMLWRSNSPGLPLFVGTP